MAGAQCPCVQPLSGPVGDPSVRWHNPAPRLPSLGRTQHVLSPSEIGPFRPAGPVIGSVLRMQSPLVSRTKKTQLLMEGRIGAALLTKPPALPTLPFVTKSKASTAGTLFVGAQGVVVLYMSRDSQCGGASEVPQFRNGRYLLGSRTHVM